MVYSTCSMNPVENEAVIAEVSTIYCSFLPFIWWTQWCYFLVTFRGCLVWGHNSPRHQCPHHGTVISVAGETSAAGVWRAARYRGRWWPPTKHPLSLEMSRITICLRPSGVVLTYIGCLIVSWYNKAIMVAYRILKDVWGNWTFVSYRLMQVGLWDSLVTSLNQNCFIRTLKISRVQNNLYYGHFEKLDL
jgi:hypothetical protein